MYFGKSGESMILQILLIVSFLWPLTTAARAATNTEKTTVTLQQACEEALQRTQTMSIQTARIAQAEERLQQGRGTTLPRVDFNWTYLRQDVPSAIPQNSLPAAGLAREDQVTTKIAATQPLFQGFREFAGIGSLKADLQAQKSLSASAKLNLFSTVTQSYFGVLAAEKDLENIKSSMDAAEKRLKSLSSFTRLGRSRRTDLLSSQSQLATLKAQAIAAEGARIQARERFAIDTGLAADSVLAEINEPLPDHLPQLDSLTANLSDRPDVKALDAQLESAQQGIRVARANYWPSLDLNGNYYLNRTGYLEGSKWDLGVTLVFPLYEGGQDLSRVRQATDVVTERKLLLEQTKRSALFDVTNAYRQVASGLEQIRMIKNALDLAEKTYELQSHDYAVGATTNLEVLQALIVLGDARRQRDRTYYQTLASLAELSVAQGKSPF
jgi:outer membrane protein